MEQEPKRSIMIESDNVSSFSLGFDGPGWTRIVRSLWSGGQHLRAVACLMQSLKGIQFDVAIKILEGKLQLVGQSPEMKVVVDNEPGLPTLDQAMARHEERNMLAAVGSQVVQGGREREKASNPIVSHSKPTMSEVYNAIKQEDLQKEVLKTKKKLFDDPIMGG